jgi:predicted nucleic acid-binding protein
MVARREWTRAWWETRLEYELVTSDAVFYELERGNYPGEEAALKLMSEVSVIEVADEVVDIIKAYTDHKVMPVDPLGDALHLALASYHRCDFLLTWNCQNLANPNKFGHIRIVNQMLGLFVPELVTPYQLLEEVR